MSSMPRIFVDPAAVGEREIRITDPGITSTSYLLWNDRRYQSPATRQFRHFLRDQSRLIEGNLID